MTSSGAYRQGHAAYQAGAPVGECPYHAYRPEYVCLDFDACEDWEAGWYDAADSVMVQSVDWLDDDGEENDDE